MTFLYIRANHGAARPAMRVTEDEVQRAADQLMDRDLESLAETIIRTAVEGSPGYADPSACADLVAAIIVTHREMVLADAEADQAEALEKERLFLAIEAAATDHIPLGG